MERVGQRLPFLALRSFVNKNRRPHGHRREMAKRKLLKRSTLDATTDVEDGIGISRNVDKVCFVWRYHIDEGHKIEWLVDASGA